MKIPKKLWIVVGTVLVIMVGVGLLIEHHSSSSSSLIYPDKIIIGTETWPGYICLFVARDMGYFRQEGLNVEIKRYLGLGQLSKDYVAGQMQGRANLNFDTVNESLHGFNQKVVLAIDYSNGSDAIVGSNQINHIKEFKGKRISYEAGTYPEYFLTWALEKNGLSIKDVVSVTGDPESVVKNLIAHKIDGGVTYEPFLTTLMKSHQGHVVMSSAEAPGLIADVLTFRADFVESHPEVVRAILRAYFKAYNLLQSEPQTAHQILAKEFGDTPENVADQLDGILLLDEKQNITAFTYATGLQSMYGNLQRILEFFKENHAGVSRQLDIYKLIDSQPLRQVLDELPR